MSFILKMLSFLFFTIYMAGVQPFSSFFIFKANLSACCKICTIPLGDLSHNDGNSEDMPCESEESQEEVKEMPLSSEFLHLPINSNIYYNFGQILLPSPILYIFSPPPKV